MNEAPDRQDASGTVDPFAAELQAVLGTYPPSPDQMKRAKARKAELDFRWMKRRVDSRQRRLEESKERAKRVLRGETDYE